MSFMLDCSEEFETPYAGTETPSEDTVKALVQIYVWRLYWGPIGLRSITASSRRGGRVKLAHTILRGESSSSLMST